MTLKEEALNRIKVAEGYLKCAKEILEQDNPPAKVLFNGLKNVEYAKDFLSDARSAALEMHLAKYNQENKTL